MTTALLTVLTLATGLTALRLALLGSLVHGIQDAEIMFRVLEVAFRHDPVAAAGRVAAELQIFLEQLLGRPADAHVRTAAVEDMVAIQGNIAAGMMANRPAATSSATPASAATGPVIATTHAFHVHIVAVVLSRCGQPAPRWGVLRGRPERIPTPRLT